MSKRIDYTNKKFNRLTGVKPVGKTPAGKMVWLFKCNCGNEIQAVGAKVKSGHTKSCGCIKRNTQLLSL